MLDKKYSIIDLSHQLFVDMPSYPNLPSFKIDYIKLAPKDGFTVSIITSMHTHLGTHIDYPSHVEPNAKCSDDYSLEDLMGEGIVINLTHKREGEEITDEDLMKFNRYIKRGKMLFIFTGWSKKRATASNYLFNWPYIGEDAAKFLVEKDIKVLGIDGLSVGGWSGRKAGQRSINKTPSRRIHEILLGAEILLVEEVANLDKILLNREIAEAFFIIAPLPIKGAEAAPCRVFSITQS